MKKTIFVVFLALVLCCLGVYAAADAGADQNVTEGVVVTLHGAATTGTIFWTQTSGPSVTLNNPLTSTPTFTADDPKTYEFELTVNESGTVTKDKVSVKATRPNMLEITDLDVKVGTETDKNIEGVENGYVISEEAKPEDNVRFDVEVTSQFDEDVDDIDIEDISVTITIFDIDDDDDLEEESDSFDLRAEDDDSVSLSFDVPLEVDEGNYKVLIEIEGEDEDNIKHYVTKELELEVKKEKHLVTVSRINLNPATLKCTRTATLSTQIMNLGREEEDEVSLEIMSSELSINSITNDIELSEDWDDDDNSFEKTLTITLPDSFKAGSYPISVKSYYDSKVSDSKTVELVVEDCKPVVEEPEEEEEVPDDEVVVIPDEQEIPDDVVPAEPIDGEVTTPEFMQSSEFYTLVVIVVVLVIGLIIFLIGAFVIRASKK